MEPANAKRISATSTSEGGVFAEGTTTAGEAAVPKAGLTKRVMEGG